MYGVAGNSGPRVFLSVGITGGERERGYVREVMNVWEPPHSQSVVSPPSAKLIVDWESGQNGHPAGVVMDINSDFGTALNFTLASIGLAMSLEPAKTQ